MEGQDRNSLSNAGEGGEMVGIIIIAIAAF